ncbi:MAG: OadG family protein [Thiohalocapsa sp.]|jgi:oxaloacetate decarboxylase gamma subunit|uniref:OadG family transporter subunit n=1 Tax=Thiohalocapsa sp. TaxID=2497641 RepID=UPI0025DA22D4|nr:OadG family transporter subunit [Thiohalocapsa sp.]MCG6943230.1 OadG family protein [Thiohalocapsa sp.]
MSETALLLESLRLLMIGMGIVFSFLLLLVGMLRLMSWAALRLAPVSAAPAPQTSAAADDRVVAVIAAAVARYRAGRGRPRH